MRILLIIAALICFSGSAFAQSSQMLNGVPPADQNFWRSTNMNAIVQYENGWSFRLGEMAVDHNHVKLLVEEIDQLKAQVNALKMEIDSLKAQRGLQHESNNQSSWLEIIKGVSNQTLEPAPVTGVLQIDSKSDALGYYDLFSAPPIADLLMIHARK
jgi:hypothetical protein